MVLLQKYKIDKQIVGLSNCRMSIYVDSEETADGALSLTASRQNILWAEMAMESSPQT